jgi:hypothetical protein
MRAAQWWFMAPVFRVEGMSSPFWPDDGRQRNSAFPPPNGLHLESSLHPRPQHRFPVSEP